MVIYMMKIIELRDQLFSIGTHIDDEELIPMKLNSFSPPWEAFV